MPDYVPMTGGAAQSGEWVVSGSSGERHQVLGVTGYFEGTGPQTGTLSLVFGSSGGVGGTTVWEAAVSGGLSVGFAPGAFLAGDGEEVTLKLSGGKVILSYGTQDA